MSGGIGVIRRFFGALVLLAIPVVAQAQVLIAPEPYISSSGVVSGALLLPDGTAANPSMGFNSDNDGTGTGLYRVAANQIGFAVNGTNRIIIGTLGRIKGSNGTFNQPSYSFTSEIGLGMWRPGTEKLAFSVSDLVFDLENTNDAGGSANLATISSTLGIMDGSDAFKGLSVELVSVDHTGVGNVIAGITATAYTEDAQTRETWIDLPGGVDVGIASVGAIFDRQDFDEPMRVIPDDLDNMTVDLADGDVNFVATANGIQFEYREEQTKTASSMVFTATGGLDISADNGASDNEGVEIYLGASQNTTTGYLVAQTDQLCFSVNVNVALIAGTDQLVIGWRGNAAYVADNLYAGYAEYAVIGINNVDGSIFALSETATGPDTGSDDSETNWADTETKTLKVCIDGAGLTHHYLDGTLIAEDDGSNPNDFAMTSGTIMNPFISYLGISGTDAAAVINWWEKTAN